MDLGAVDPTAVHGAVGHALTNDLATLGAIETALDEHARERATRRDRPPPSGGRLVARRQAGGLGARAGDASTARPVRPPDRRVPCPRRRTRRRLPRDRHAARDRVRRMDATTAATAISANGIDSRTPSSQRTDGSSCASRIDGSRLDPRMWRTRSGARSSAGSTHPLPDRVLVVHPLSDTGPDGPGPASTGRQ